MLLVCAGLLVWYFRPELTAALHSRPSMTAPESKQAPRQAGKAVQRSASKRSKEGSAVPEAADRFEFYDMLPDAEVEVTEQPQTPRVLAPPLVSVPGTYVVQAGAFPDFAAADKVKARLALLGVVSEIQVADASGTLFHRVRIGPIDNLDELNRLRARLRQNGIEHQVIPVGE
jgi:cell division protein FtsN